MMMMAMDGKQHLSHPGLHAHGVHESMRRVCLPGPPQLQANILGGGVEESLLARAEALQAAADSIRRDGCTFHTMSTSTSSSSSVSLHVPAIIAPQNHHHHHHHHQLGQSLEAGDLLEHLSSSLAVTGMGAPEPGMAHHHHQHHHLQTMGQLHQAMAAMGHPHPAMPAHSDVESDPRELEAFAERFKQRRIKLGVTQADVGSALADLKIPGVGSLSQSTICRFESLTLSHNNMIALKPVLHAWLEEAEAAHRDRSAKQDLLGGAGAGGPGDDARRRRRTSIAAPEKRSLEAYFAIQPRPSSEKIAAIAEKLDLKKNVVRVWFCNQRQKQKRMKYSAVH
ncbi:POU domain, class 4, transcription factor 3-like [Dunckerocampus dactyliophorus]|uniref:POU domain, class 4, transcription factor 3-like n=1 Tax=Dunckerocampus dactyliophorus TaxID=161453 RepID=UPI00240596F1|nr:POU domain, class 4, transcription factor 3-like [Dunckerocampus dactyliophorus]